MSLRKGLAERLRSRTPSPAMVVASLALFFALGGSALAAKHYLISSTKQISPKVLKKLQGKKGAAGATGPVGPAGPKGETGAKGETGPAGSAIAYAHVIWNGTTASFDAANTKGMGSATVTHRATSAFCFANLPFTPHNATVTVDWATSATGFEIGQVQIEPPGGKTLDCPAPENVEVATANANKGEFVAQSFFITFN